MWNDTSLQKLSIKNNVNYVINVYILIAYWTDNTRCIELNKYKFH